MPSASVNLDWGTQEAACVIEAKCVRIQHLSSEHVLAGLVYKSIWHTGPLPRAHCSVHSVSSFNMGSAWHHKLLLSSKTISFATKLLRITAPPSSKGSGPKPYLIPCSTAHYMLGRLVFRWSFNPNRSPAKSDHQTIESCMLLLSTFLPSISAEQRKRNSEH